VLRFDPIDVAPRVRQESSQVSEINLARWHLKSLV
jgi:hypothetical protein